MFSEIEARYLDVEWLERGRARRIEVSPEPLDIELGADGVLRVETEIFHGFHPWLGLRLTGQLDGCAPAFVDAAGNEHPMLQLEDGAGSKWWVQNDGWDADKQRHLSELHRTMGRFEVRIGEHRLLIENVSTGLGRTQVEEYLQDFKRELIWLVLSSGSATSAGKGSLFGNELPKALSDFTAAADRLRARPAHVLREISAETPLSRLRPNAASFRHHARNPASPRLVGRASVETADTADNRYLRHMVQICNRLAVAAMGTATQQSELFEERARFEDGRASAYQETEFREVDPKIFDHQQNELSKKLQELATWSNASPSEQAGDGRDYTIELGNDYGKSNCEFFYKKPNESDQYAEKNDISYNVIKLPEDLCRLMIGARYFCKRYTLRGYPSIKRKESSAGKLFRHVDFQSVASVIPDRGALERKEKTKARLQSQGWEVPLTDSEREELRRDARAAASRANIYRALRTRAIESGAKIGACQAALRRQDTHWQALGVRSQPAFPMGMRYVLSPDYAAALKAFSRVRELANHAGIDEEALDDLNRIGILHASAIYERWCLVKIIGVLIEDFAFDPTPGWQETLIRAVTGRPESISLAFRRLDVDISATLEIQPILSNGRRPDFRLRFSAADSSNYVTIVMDSKFRAHWRPREIERLLVELVEGKNYGGENDRVFILQPQPNSVSDATSPLSWGRHCDYGHSAPSEHRAGHIQLAAGAQGYDGQTNLRRLIALGLQAAFSHPPESLDEKTPATSFCISCGMRHEWSDIKQNTARAGWTLRCKGCEMETVRTHCYACSTTLFKNGVNLTYHNTMAEQITNVICPSCGAYFDRDFNEGSRNYSTKRRTSGRNASTSNGSGPPDWWMGPPDFA